jgi:hypothetical protein
MKKGLKRLSTIKLILYFICFCQTFVNCKNVHVHTVTPSVQYYLPLLFPPHARPIATPTHTSLISRAALIAFTLSVLAVAVPSVAHAQAGGKKRERVAKKRGNFMLTRWKSMGHADEFARGSHGRRGFFTRLFRKPRPSWVYKSSGSPRSHHRENQFLFTRFRTPGRVENEDFQMRRNRDRQRNRQHGNSTFKRRKFKRR